MKFSIGSIKKVVGNEIFIGFAKGAWEMEFCGFLPKSA